MKLTSGGDGLTARSRVLLVVGGYVAAFVAAVAVVAIHVEMTETPDRIASSGMRAFGDLLLFLATLGLAALPPTVAWLCFLRRRRAVWIVLSALAGLSALTGVLAVYAYLVSGTVAPDSGLSIWVTISPLRALAAPVLALLCVLAGVLAPARMPRAALLAVAAVELALFAAFAWRGGRM
jgi:hypothetical protein